jgi:hypothetical protein
MPSKFAFNSVQAYAVPGSHVTESVSVRNGEGYKMVKVRTNGNTKTSKHKLSAAEIQNIKNRRFMPALFKPCHKYCNANMKPLRKRSKTVKKGKLQRGSTR